MLPVLRTHLLSVLLTLCTAALAAVDVQPPRVTRPPTIVPDALIDDIVYYDAEGETGAELPCQALGSTPITYSWTKNGKDLDIKAPKYVLKNKDKGTIVVTDLKEHVDGYYQCKAENVYGTSYSKKIVVKKATKKTFTVGDLKVYKPSPGTFLKMICNPPDNDPPSQVRWVKFSGMGETQQYVELNDRKAIDLDGNLYFANVQKIDENFGEEYACESTLKKLVGIKIGGAYSKIKVLDGDATSPQPVQLQYHSPATVTALKGDRVKMKCIFSGNPTPQIEWVRIGGKMDLARMNPAGHNLIINDIKYEDAGTYECRGENTAIGSVPVKKRFTLIVEARPSWTAKPMAVDAGVTETATYECGAEGKPPPRIDWYINGVPIGNLKDDTRRILNQGQLRFIDLEQDDAQVIQCNASNVHGYLWADVGLSILAYKPEIKVPFTYKKVAEGQTVILPCQVDGKPNPDIYWKRGAQIMKGNRYKMNKSGNLTIVNAEVEDEGFWTCFAENKYGKINLTGELVVREKTKIKVPPWPAVQETKFQSETEFSCSATTDHEEQDKLTISWLHNGIPVDWSNPRLTRTHGKGLKISGTSSKDSGEYTCVASNGIDSDSKKAVLKVLAPPDPPTDITFDSCLSRSVIVTWKPGKANFSPILRYYVEFNNSYTPHIWKNGANVTDAKRTSAKISLSPYANYTFRVIAVNDYGASEPSKRSTAVCESNPERPDMHPKNVHTDRSKPGFLIVKWKRMEEIEHNAEGFHYILTIQKDGMTNSYTISNWTQTSMEFDKQLIFEPYMIYVTAVNSIGEFHEGAQLHVGYTGEAEPLTAPGNLEILPGTNATARTVWLQWDPVDLSPDKIRGVFQGYKLRYWRIGEEETTMRIISIPRSPPADNRVKRVVQKEKLEVKGLRPFTDFSMDVVARNTYYDSNASNTINVTTEEGEPGPVKSAEVKLRGSSHFVLKWDSPEEPNGLLTGYEIGYRKIDGLRLAKMVIVANFNDSSTNEGYIDNLDPDTAYRITVWAKTSKGTGEPYDFDAKTANSGSLIKQPKVEISLVGEDFINVTWSVEESDTPAGSHHYVKYRKYGEIEWLYTEKEVINTWANISNLEPKTMYEICVVAETVPLTQQSAMMKVQTAGEVGPSVNEEKSIAQASWFIVMMVLIAALILFIIIVCFIKRSRGEKYNVQEREKFGGTDPENGDKDLFNEYPKSGETDPLAAGSPDSFDNEPDKLPGGSETDSMAEYGDVDPSKFNEDGSFIGQYGSQKPEEKGNQPSAMSTFV